MRIERFPLGPLWTNGYLFVGDEGRAFFVDPGGDPEEVIERLRRDALSLDAIVLTHGHVDHIAGVSRLAEETGAIIVISEADATMLSDPDESLSRWLGVSFPPTRPGRTIGDGDRLRVGGMELEFFETPGHTEGSVCVLVRHGAEHVLLSGDTLFARSVGRTDLPGGDSDALEKSLYKLASFPDTLRVLPGHGPETTIGVERLSNPYWPRLGQDA